MSRLTLSIHKVRTDDQGNPTLLRALLWNGYLTWHVDSILWTATWDHPNFFHNLSGLRKEVTRELEHRGDVWKNIIGIHTDAPCWPLDPSVPLSPHTFELNDEGKVRTAANHPILHCGGYKGLSCFVVPEEAIDSGAASYRALLYDFLPLPPCEHVQKSVIGCAYFGNNLFRVAMQLRTAVIESALSQKLSNVRGLFDNNEGGLNNGEACWPEGLGVIRYQ